MSDIVLHTPWQPLHIRVFYVRISDFIVDDATPDCLTLNLIPLCQDTVLKVNGTVCSIEMEGISCVLRRDRVDKKSEEVTFVSTDSITSTGSVKFEVLDKESLLITGALDLSSSSGSNNWSMNCQSMVTSGEAFFNGRQFKDSGYTKPALEVYVAGCFSGSPIILTKTLQLNRKRNGKISVLDTIPEYDGSESHEDAEQESDLQLSDYGKYELENEEDFYNLYWSTMEDKEAEDWELSWFNAGVRVGVGLGLGICLGVGDRALAALPKAIAGGNGATPIL
ncbi:hypothetical protein F511_01042 [Dorcoceras hygrometricum]|uniref:Erythronate-4-phosphate dehydrogenase family protein n=1 Tax=Dorcoceras hygrometricum TaxID=472368 RepID=A0A2Z7AEK9_9LAMI|nr:hypothetical protein F511_01042 [Dorcoceras hygrometricum]